MDNAMVKRGIGAVILAIIAALLLGYLLKDKSDQRQDIVDMTLPGAPKIPSLSENKTEAPSIVESKTTTMGDNALSQMKAVTTSVVAKVESKTQSTERAIIDGNTVKLEIPNQNTNSANNETNNNPGFSFRPPSQNEEQKINNDSTTEVATTTSSETTEPEATNNTVVTTDTPEKTETPEEKFKPVIENEPKKKPAKTVIKKVVKQEPAKKPSSKPSKPKATSSGATNEKYTIQLLATSSRSRANKLAETMTSEGYVSFITQTTSNNKILYRVRVGGYKSRDAALKAQQGMKRRYQKNFNVQNSLVVAQ